MNEAEKKLALETVLTESQLNWAVGWFKHHSWAKVALNKQSIATWEKAEAYGRQQAFKEVGEWLEKKLHHPDYIPYSNRFSNKEYEVNVRSSDIESLKRGEL